MSAENTARYCALLMFPEKHAVMFVFLVAFSPSVRLCAAPTARPASAEPTPANGGGLSDPSKLLLLFNDDDGDHPDRSKSPGLPTPARPEGRYLFGLLDHRSSYGEEFFPDPFLGPEFDRETQVEVDYQHGERGGQREDEGEAGVEWNLIGQLTLANEFGYDSEHQPEVLGGGTEGKNDKAGSGRGFEKACEKQVFW